MSLGCARLRSEQYTAQLGILDEVARLLHDTGGLRPLDGDSGTNFWRTGRETHASRSLRGLRLLRLIEERVERED